MMEQNNKQQKSWRKKGGNILFFGLLLFFAFSTSAKSWLLQQAVSVGLFKAEIKKVAAATATTASFSFTNANGQTQSTSDFKGKVVFINFWATWCPPCRAEMPSLNELYNQFKNDNRFVFLFINEDEDWQKAKDYLQKAGFAIPLSTSSGLIPAELYSGTLPTTLVLDKDGRLVMKHEGLADYNRESFIQQLKALL